MPAKIKKINDNKRFKKYTFDDNDNGNKLELFIPWILQSNDVDFEIPKLKF